MKHVMHMTRRVHILALAALLLLALLVFAACGTEQTPPADGTTADASTPDATDAVTTAADTTAASDESVTDPAFESATDTDTLPESESESETESQTERETETTPLPVADDVYYVALGDSIARGYGVDLKTVSYAEDGTRSATFDPSFYQDDGTANFAPRTYTAQLRDLLLQNSTVDGAYNFARSGDDCGDLLDFIHEFCNADGTVKDPDKPNSRYAALTNAQIFAIMQDAKVVSVCIGANNVLGPALELLPKYMADEVTYEAMEASMRAALEGNGTTTGLEADMNALLPRLQALCPEAEIVFTTVYNPYKIMEFGEGMLFLQMMGIIKDAAVKLERTEQLSEICIAGGKDSTGAELIGINAILEKTVKAFSETAGGRFHIVDAKARFDAALEEDGGHYCDYVNTDMGLLTAKDANNFATYADPHPTPAGHDKLFLLHKALLDTLDLAEK